MALAYVYVTCPACEWKSSTHYAGPSGRMMGVNTAGNAAEDEFDAHYAIHLKPQSDADEKAETR